MKLENKIKQILNEMNINIRLKGYRYWVDAVKYVIESNKTFYSMTREVYPNVGKIYGDTPSKVERALRHAHEINQSSIKEYFNVKYKIDNSSFLALIVEKIKLEMSEE